MRAPEVVRRVPESEPGRQATEDHGAPAMQHDGPMYIESPFGEFADYAVVRLTVEDVTQLRDVLSRMLADGPSADFRAYVPPATTGTQTELAWELGD